MDILELLNSVESEELRTQILTAHNSAVESEKTVGISKYNKKDSELKKYKDAVRDLGYDPEKYTGVSDFVEAKKAEKTEPKQDDSATKLLQKQLNDLTAQLESEKATAKRSKIESKLTSELGKKFNGADLIIKTLITDGAVDIDGDNVFFKNGDDVTTFDDGIKSLESKYANLLVVNQVAGGGDTGGETGTENKSWQSLSLDEALKATT